MDKLIKDFKYTKMYKVFRFLSIYILSSLLMSCSGLLYTSIDVLRPAQIVFPTDINSVAVVNNSVKQPHTTGHKNDLFNDKSFEIEVDTDSISIYAIASFVEAMQDTEFFDYVGFELNSQNTSSDFSSLSLLSTSEIDIQLKNQGVDALVVLNRIAVNDLLGELYDTEGSTFISYLEARYEYNWSVHFKNKVLPISLIIKDTVYWEAESYFRKRSMENMPDRRNALIDGALISGKRAVKQFIPYWEKEDRYFFKLSGKQFNAGLEALYRKNWDDAIRIWDEKRNNTKNTFYKAKLAHNIAVLYEIKADIEKALDYSNQSMEAFDELLLMDLNKYVIIIEQNQILHKRLTHQNKLNQQLGILD